MFDSIVHIRPDSRLLLGSSAAQNAVSQLLPVIQQANRPDTLVIFDFTGVEHTNGSFLRASLFWALMCGKTDVTGEEAAAVGGNWSPRPFPLFPVLAGCQREIAGEIHDFLKQRSVAALLLDMAPSEEIESARLLGYLDSVLSTSLDHLSTIGEGTAVDLKEYSKEGISVNGWSNRLLDLFSMRLVTRRRNGKFWIYKPVAKSHLLWA